MTSSGGGTTRLMLGLDAARADRDAGFLAAVQRAVGEHFEVLGEMGHGAKGRIVYLAREAGSGHLVALQLTPGESAPDGEVWLEVLRQLDASVPAGEGVCPRCSVALRGWARFCGQCGADLSGVVDASPDRLLDAVRAAAGAEYEVLGPMERAEGGGAVYFARERSTGRIVALRLERDATAGAREQYSLGRTMVLDKLVESLAGRDATLPPSARAPTADAPPVPPPLAAPAVLPSLTPLVAPRPGALLWPAAAVGLAAVAAAGGVWYGRRPALKTPLPSAPAVIAAATTDSGEIRIGGALPKSATVTVDGTPMTGGVVRLAPGGHTVHVTARGYAPLTPEMQVDSGQTVLWAPQLAAAARPAPFWRPG